MLQSILHVKPEDMDTVKKRENYTVSVIGCGPGGVLHAFLFAEAGFKIICVDADQAKVTLLAKGKAAFLEHEVESKLKAHVKAGRLKTTNDTRAAVSQSDIIIVAIPAKIDEKKKADYSDVENTCKSVGSSLRRGSLVILITVVGFGFTEGVIKEILQNSSGLKVGVDFGLAYSPFQVLSAHPFEPMKDHERTVAALEQNSLNSASVVLGTIGKKSVKKVADLKLAELAVLFDNVQRDVKVALANEFAIFCEKAGVDYLEIHKLLNNSDSDVVYLPMLAEENIRKEAYLLLEDAENFNVKLRIPTIATETDEKMARHAVNLTKNALREGGKTLRRARIALLGIGQKTNTKSPPKAVAKELAIMLEAKGAKVSLHDPYFSEHELTDIPYPFKRNLTEAVERADCLIVLRGHDQFKRLNLKKLKVVMRMPAAIVDFEGIIEPDKVEKEGFIYRGLGRGVWKK